MKTLTYKITATPNHKNRTFTIRKIWSDGTKSKYRTNPVSFEEFNQDLNNTDNDWKQYLSTSNDYYIVN